MKKIQNIAYNLQVGDTINSGVFVRLKTGDKLKKNTHSQSFIVEKVEKKWGILVAICKVAPDTPFFKTPMFYVNAPNYRALPFLKTKWLENSDVLLLPKGKKFENVFHKFSVTPKPKEDNFLPQKKEFLDRKTKNKNIYFEPTLF